jgi:tRNA (adenine57-N1/adenine58-N1)-methyltransferase catalytic subunit
MFECLIRNQEVYSVKKLSVDHAIQNIRYMDARRKEHKAKPKRSIDEVNEEEEPVSTVSPVAEDDIPDMTISRTRLEMKGHTSYLTFATFLPVEAGTAPAATE